MIKVKMNFKYKSRLAVISAIKKKWEKKTFKKNLYWVKIWKKSIMEGLNILPPRLNVS